MKRKLILLLIGAGAGIMTAWFLHEAVIPVEPTQFDPAEVEQSIALATNWFTANQTDEGLFAYSNNPATGAYQDSNNVIRQAMSSRLVAEAAQSDPTLLPLHERNLEGLFAAWYQEANGVGYMVRDEKSKLGGNALMLRTLLYSPLYDQYEAEAAALYQSLIALQGPDGSFRAFYTVPANYQYDEDYLLTFYSGEALLAMMEYYENTGDPVVLADTIRSADFYVNRYVNEIDTYYYPAYVPWHTLALNKLYQITGNETYAAAIFTLNDKLISEMLDVHGAHVGRFYNPRYPHYGSPHTSSDGVYTEGVVYALEIAQLTGDTEREAAYRTALSYAVPYLLGLQYTEARSDFYTDPDTYLGAFPVRDDSTWIRVDTTQHIVDGFTKLLTVW